MKKIIYIVSVLLAGIFQSCTKNFEETNTNPNQFNAPDAEAIFTGVAKATVDQMERNNYLFFWTYSNFFAIDGGTARYGSGDDTNWQQMYVNVLGNINQLKKRYKDNPQYANRIQIAEIWECYAYSYLVGIYGPIPYSQAMVTNTPVIEFDDENTVYKSLLERLKNASDGLKLTGADTFTPDVVFNGDLLKWKKFANSLRLRIALRCLRNQPEAAEAAIRELMADETLLMQGVADNAKLSYGTGEGNEAPYFIRLVKNTIADGDFPKLNDYLFTNFRSYKDPRLSAYFEPVPVADQYAMLDTLASTADDTLRIVSYKIPHLGSPKSPAILPAWGLIGQSPISGTVFKNFSKPKASILTSNKPFNIMDYAEVCFMKAEAKFLNYGGAKTAEEYYKEAITTNFTTWGIAASAPDYLNTNGIKWDTQGKGFNYYTGLVNTDIPLDNLTKIWTQRWINYYPDGAFDAWCLQRRTLSLDLPPLTNAGNPNLNSTITDIPDRWEYPNVERTYNPTGYNNAIAKFGANDLPTVSLKFAKPVVRRDWNTARAFYDPKYIQKWYGPTIQSLSAAGIPYVLVNKFVRP